MREPNITSQDGLDVQLLDLRNSLRQLEFALPLVVQAALFRLLGKSHDPYDKRSHETQSIFVHIPRAAGTSVALSLKRSSVHYPVSRYAAVNRDCFERYFKFTFVRNPWDRLLSCYSRLQSTKMAPETAVWAKKYVSQFTSFHDFVLALRNHAVRAQILEYFVFRPQVRWLSFPRTKKLQVDFVGRFESLEADFATVCEKLGVTATLPATNESDHQPYRRAYTTRMRDIVSEVYSDDIEALHYEF